MYPILIAISLASHPKVATAASDDAFRSQALLVRPTRCNIQGGYAILRSMSLTYLEYDPNAGEEFRVRISVARAIAADTHARSV